MNISLPQNISKKLATSGPVKQSATNKSAGVVVLVIIIILFSWFMVMPKWRTYQTEQSQLEVFRKKQDSLDAQVKTLQQLINTMGTSSGDVAHLDQALPLDGKTINLQLLLQTLAQSSGVTIGEINFQGNANEIVAGDTSVLKDPFASQRSLQTLPGTINVSGSYDQLTSFLTKLETDGRLVDISSLEMAPDKAGIIDLRLSATTYYYE